MSDAGNHVISNSEEAAGAFRSSGSLRDLAATNSDGALICLRRRCNLAVDLLQETLDEEAVTDEALTELAEDVINQEAEDEEEETA